MSGYKRTGPNGAVCHIGNGDDAAFISLGKGRAVVHPAIEIPADERQVAAQALAGDGYRVVPAAEAAAPDGALSLIADVIGTDDLGEVLPAVEGLKEREKEAHHLKRENNDLRKKLTKAEAQAAQPDRVQAAPNEPEMYPKRDGEFVILGPECFTDDSLEVINFKGQNYVKQPDRPEPVDPASVRVGDVVDIEANDASWYIKATVTWRGQTGFMVAIPRDQGSFDYTDPITVRVLHVAQPEPDEAAVGALYEALRDVYPRAVWDLRVAANTLAKRGVRVVNPDA